MPMLQAEYGVASIAVIGPYAKGDDYEAGQLDLMISFVRTPGLEFFGMGRELGTCWALRSVLSRSLS